MLHAVRLALLCLPLAASAHDLWLERDATAYVLHQGHLPRSHSGQERLPYAASAVKAAACLDAKGAVRSVAPRGDYPVRIEAECTALLVTMSSGYWTKTAWETKNVPASGIPGVVKSWLSEETVKRLDRWAPAAAAALSQGLELAPATDPFALAPGDKLALRVFFAGKPLAGVGVAYDGDVRGATSDDGSIALRLRRPGMQTISASFEAPLADGKADTVIRAATLQFELRGK
jgi:nickel transport protein